MFVHLWFFSHYKGSQEIFVLFEGEISVVMEPWRSPRMWARRDPLSQDRESSCVQGMSTASIPGRDCGFLIHAHQQIHQTHFCFSTSSTEVLQSRTGLLYRIPEEDTQALCPCKKRRKQVLDCIWAQITEKQKRKKPKWGDSTPDFPMRYVSAESNTAQQPWGMRGCNYKHSDKNAQVATSSSEECIAT